MRGVALHGESAPAVVDALRERGVLALSAGRDVLRILPPLIIQDAEIDEALAALEGALDEVTLPAAEARP
jgi:acetylornithine/succinyldiaminopimelate/putrescine aminotransferase